MARRIGARRIALEVLFESELSKNDPEDVLKRYEGQKAAEYSATLVQGVREHIKTLDEVIDIHSTDWAVDRMPVVDRTLLRLGAFELIHEPDVPAAVVINEAVELAKEFSTDDSGRFINGVLASIARAFRKTSEPIVDS